MLAIYVHITRLHNNIFPRFPLLSLPRSLPGLGRSLLGIDVKPNARCRMRDLQVFFSFFFKFPIFFLSGIDVTPNAHYRMRILHAGSSGV
jgi:hypothetical protein